MAYITALYSKSQLIYRTLLIMARQNPHEPLRCTRVLHFYFALQGGAHCFTRDTWLSVLFRS
jgi:hypothetical protein